MHLDAGRDPVAVAQCHRPFIKFNDIKVAGQFTIGPVRQYLHVMDR